MKQAGLAGAAGTRARSAAAGAQGRSMAAAKKESLLILFFICVLASY